MRRENIGFSAANNVVLREDEAAAVLLLNPDTEVYAGTLDAALARLRSDERIGMVGCKLVTESGELDHACKRSFPTPLSALAHFTGIGRGDGAGGIAEPVPGDPPRRRRARRGRRRQRRLHALPRRGGARGRPARRGLLALHGGPRLVPALLAGGLEGLLRAGRASPCTSRAAPAASAARPNRRSPSTAGWAASTAASTRSSTTPSSTPPSTRGSAPSSRSASAITAVGGHQPTAPLRADSARTDGRGRRCRRPLRILPITL